MNVILLSGGAGRRLWPLSNDSCSKQYIKLMNEDEKAGKGRPEERCSMLQRVFGQLWAAGLDQQMVIVASEAQTELIKSQLNNRTRVDIAVEPEKRDTFPATLLGCSYLYSKYNKRDSDFVIVMPVDPYTDLDFFNLFHEMERGFLKANADIALIGALPVYPSAKYGYIVPKTGKAYLPYQYVDFFKEKPTEEEAAGLIQKGALWNCGVFGFRLGFIRQLCDKYGVAPDYDEMKRKYEDLPKTSFDYEVLEQRGKKIVFEYAHLWKDVGTWNTLTEEMREKSIGQVVFDETTRDTNAINMLDIPMIIMGAENMVVAASHDGILVADKERSSYLKEYLDRMDVKPRYEERSWGTIKTIDYSQKNGLQIKTNKVKVMAGMNTTYHCHRDHDEMISVLFGNGVIIKEGKTINLESGTGIKINSGEFHAIKAETELNYIEILTGKTVEHDIERKIYNWDEIQTDKGREI